MLDEEDAERDILVRAFGRSFDRLAEDVDDIDGELAELSVVKGFACDVADETISGQGDVKRWGESAVRRPRAVRRRAECHGQRASGSTR